MRKRLTALLPLYIAGIVMLAFAVIPHHHHNELICFTVSHCGETSDTEHHHHDPFAANEGCAKHLFQTQVTRSLSIDDDCPSGHCHHFITPMFLATGIFNIRSIQAGNDKFPDTSYREKLHSILYTSHLGGRAPPSQI